jgi:hypothetical protein
MRRTQPSSDNSKKRERCDANARRDELEPACDVLTAGL